MSAKSDTYKPFDVADYLVAEGVPPGGVDGLVEGRAVASG